MPGSAVDTQKERATAFFGKSLRIVEQTIDGLFCPFARSSGLLLSLLLRRAGAPCASPS